MTKIIGLTGGIGSGKTTVAELFEKEGVPVYYADLAGKRLMDNNPAVTARIVREFGQKICEGDKINRKALAKLVFADKSKLALLNSIIHPAVAADFAHWVDAHKHEPMVVKESAILFESGAFESCDAVVTVSAPEKLRIERVIKRDQAPAQDVIDRIDNQWNDQQREEKSDFVIVNVNKFELADQVSIILKKLQNL